MRMLAQAIREANSADSSRIRDALLKVTFTTLLGKQARFDQNNQAGKVVVLQTVKDKKVTIFVDGKKTSEWDQPADWKGLKDNPGRVLGSGTVALQAHDPGSVIRYKNIRIKQLK